MQIPRIILDCRVECGTCSDGSKCSNSPVIDKIKAQFIRLVILSGCNNCANIQRRPSSAIFKQQQMWNHRVYQKDALKKVWYLSQQSTSFSRSGDQQTRLICYWFGNTLSATKSLPSKNDAFVRSEKRMTEHELGQEKLLEDGTVPSVCRLLCRYVKMLILQKYFWNIL